MHHDRGVRALAAAGQPVDVVAGALTRVRAHDHHVEGLAGLGEIGLVGPIVSELLLDVEHVEVLGEVAVGVDGEETHAEREDEDPVAEQAQEAMLVLGLATMAAVRFCVAQLDFSLNAGGLRGGLRPMNGNAAHQIVRFNPESAKTASDRAWQDVRHPPQ